MKLNFMFEIAFFTMKMKKTAIIFIFINLGFIGLSQEEITFFDASDVLLEPHSYTEGSEMGGGLSFVDFNQDGYDDLSLTTSEGERIHFYINNQSGSYERVYLEGVVNEGVAKQILWADIDNDRDYDLFISANDTGNRMYLNTGNLRFQDVTNSCGIDHSDVDNNSFGSVFSDFNKDGNLDLYVVNRNLGTSFGPFGNKMYYGNGHGSFIDVTETSNTDDGYKAPMCVTAIDYDLDGWEDLYIPQDKHLVNTMLRNVNGNGFESTGVSTNTDFALDGMSSSVADVNGDGYLDIYCTDVTASILLINKGNSVFVEESELRGCRMLGEFGWGASFCDVDNDLDIDLFVSVGSFHDAGHDILFLNDGNGFFTEAEDFLGAEEMLPDFSFGNMYGDINNDGFPDLVTNNHFESSVVLKNRGNANNWLKYKLTGTQSNRDGIGAYLRFYIDGISYLRNMQAGEGYSCQRSYRQIFGMGANQAVDSLSILWPNGQEDWHYDLKSFDTYNFVEGEIIEYSLVSSNGLEICDEGSTVLTVEGEYQSLLWNNELNSNHFEANYPQQVSLMIEFNNGITRDLIIEIEHSSPNFQIEEINGTEICSNEVEANVTVEFNSDEPVEIFWNDVLGESSTVIPLGVSQLKLIDANGCTIQQEFEVTNFEETVINSQTVNPNCHGESSGQLILDLQGQAPYQIVVNDAPTGLYLGNLPHGEYYIEIADAFGCVKQEQVTIEEPEEFSFEFLTIPDNGTSEGEIQFTFMGGTAPYYIDGDETNLVSGLSENNYEFEICDANNCCSILEVEIEFINSIKERIQTELVVYPNPTSNRVIIKNYSGQVENLRLFDFQGRELKIVSIMTNKDSIELDFLQYSDGIYHLTSRDNLVSLRIIKMSDS